MVGKQSALDHWTFSFLAALLTTPLAIGCAFMAAAPFVVINNIHPLAIDSVLRITHPS